MINGALTDGSALGGLQHSWVGGRGSLGAPQGQGFAGTRGLGTDKLTVQTQREKTERSRCGRNSFQKYRWRSRLHNPLCVRKRGRFLKSCIFEIPRTFSSLIQLTQQCKRRLPGPCVEGSRHGGCMVMCFGDPGRRRGAGGWPGGVQVRTSAGDACADGTRARPVAPLIPCVFHAILEDLVRLDPESWVLRSARQASGPPRRRQAEPACRQPMWLALEPGPRLPVVGSGSHQWTPLLK